MENLMRQEKAQETCVILPLHDLMKGPKHVAESIIREQEQKDGKEKKILTDEQKLVFALWVDNMQEAWLKRPDPEKHYLPPDTWILDMILDGGGGCGKTMLINCFIVPLCKAFWGPAGVVCATTSNKAAVGIRGKTFHSLLGLTPDSSMRTSQLALTNKNRVKLEKTFLNMGALIKDEFSMMAGQMNHAGSLLATYARESEYRLVREDYAKPRERWGRVATMLDAGDHLQLPPVPKKNSVIARLENTSQEHRVGAAIFRNARYVFQMKKMMRFKDDVLIRILDTMRTIGGKALAETDWQKLLETEMTNDQHPPGNGWYHTCYVWSVIAMASYVEARQSARDAKTTLFYIQAVDRLTNMDTGAYVGRQETHIKKLYHSLLRVPSLSKTKRLPGFCLLHVGMEVRLLTTLDPGWAVQDSTGTVLELQWDEHDKQLQKHSKNALPDAEVLLNQMPIAVLVKLHDCEHVFLPVQPCDMCQAFTSECTHCVAKRDKLKGVFPVEPIKKSWR